MPKSLHDQHTEQEASIKQRSTELFLKGTSDQKVVASKPFSVHLRETEAQPLSAGTKAILWIIGLLVGLLFLAAIWRIVQRNNATPLKTALPSRSFEIQGDMGRLIVTSSAPRVAVPLGKSLFPVIEPCRSSGVPRYLSDRGTL